MNPLSLLPTTTQAAVKIARRELRGGLHGFRVFLGCLILGVGAIAAVGSLSEAIQSALVRDGRVILGGDVKLRLSHEPASAEQRAWFASPGRVTESIEMRAMARRADGDARTLVELKGVDGAYPLFGSVELAPAQALPTALETRLVDGEPVFGVAVEEGVLNRLDAAIGDRLMIGDATVEVRAQIVREPDRSTGQLILGPRLMLSADAIWASGLIKPGSLVRYHYRIDVADAGIGAWVEALQDEFPDAGWQQRDLRDPAPGLSALIDRLTLFMTLVGLTALLVGGVGVSNAVSGYLENKTATIATLKCLGAPPSLVFQAYLSQILALSSIGIAVGLVLGVATPPLAGWFLGDALPVQVRFGIHPSALALAALFGLLSAIAFTLWPLGRAREIPGATLFRDRITPAHVRPRASVIAAIALFAVGLAATAILSAEEKQFAWGFVGGALAVFLVFRLAAMMAMAVAKRAGRPRWPGLRLAIANLCRPGAPTPSIVLSLGLGLTVLVAVVLIEANLNRRIGKTIAEEAPGFYFIDIQPDQLEPFLDTVRNFPGVDQVASVPMLRGRITHIDGTPASEVTIAQDAQWTLRGDRGLTWAVAPPENSIVVAGDWWAPDYRGPPLISFDAEIAAAYGIGIGDTLTVNVLGRAITAEIGNLRQIDWSTLGINFVIVYAPGALEGAPRTHIATVVLDPAQEGALERAVIEAFPNVSAIRTKEAIKSVNEIVAKVGTAIRSTASIAIIAGVLVLAGAVAAGHARRVYDGVVLKVLGARRREILAAYLIEFGLLGLITAAISGVLGTLVGWLVVTQVMEDRWTFFPTSLLTVSAIALAITLGLGFVGTWRALGEPAAPLLRNE